MLSPIPNPLKPETIFLYIKIWTYTAKPYIYIYTLNTIVHPLVTLNVSNDPCRHMCAGAWMEAAMPHGLLVSGSFAEI